MIEVADCRCYTISYNINKSHQSISGVIYFMFI